MSDFFNNAWTNCTNWFGNITNEATGNVLIMLGEHMQEVSLIIIVLGMLLVICRKTKVLRWGFISYLLGLLIELLGLLLIR